MRQIGLEGLIGLGRFKGIGYINDMKSFNDLVGDKLSKKLGDKMIPTFNKYQCDMRKIYCSSHRMYDELYKYVKTNHGISSPRLYKILMWRVNNNVDGDGYKENICASVRRGI